MKACDAAVRVGCLCVRVRPCATLCCVRLVMACVDLRMADLKARAGLGMPVVAYI